MVLLSIADYRICGCKKAVLLAVTVNKNKIIRKEYNLKIMFCFLNVKSAYI